jgi:O-antigen ligase
MKAIARSYNPFNESRFIAGTSGILIALVTTFLLRYPFVWAFLFVVGLAVAIFSLTARDFRSYWLAIFALVLPLDIKKMLIDSGPVMDYVLKHGFPVGELPGPVLYLSDLPFLVLMVQWLLEIIFKKKRIYFPQSNWMALAFILWSIASLVKTTEFSSSIFELLRMIKFYLLYLYVANNVQSKETVKTLMKFLFIGLMFQGLLCLSQYLIQDISYMFGNLMGKKDFYSDAQIKIIEPIFRAGEDGNIGIRASGTVGPINAQAQYFEFLLPVAFLLWLTATTFWSSSFRLITFVFGLLGLVVTFSRGGFAGITIGLGVVLMLSKWFKIMSNRKFLIFFFITLTLWVVMAPRFYGYFMARPEATSARLHLSKVGLEMVRAHPILGVGLNNHVVVKPEYDPRKYAFPMPVHNHYLIIASETGIPGLAFFLSFMGLTCLCALKAARSKDLYLASVAVGILGGLTAIALHILVDYLGSHTNMTLLWIYGGLAAALGEKKMRPSEVTFRDENRTH